MIDYFEGAPVTDGDTFNFHLMEVMRWDPFLSNNSALKELISSGSLGVLSDDRLKNDLLQMELAYDKIDVTQDHMRFDYQEYLYGPFFRIGDVWQSYRSYQAFQKNAGEHPYQKPIAPSLVGALLGDPAFKNGFSLCVLNSRDLVIDLQAVAASSRLLLERINTQLND